MRTRGDIIFCGVGGQGILLASELTSLALMKSGFDVKKSEVHGMAQRGGSVTAHVRYGERVYSPLIEPGKADIMVSFELIEALRYISFVNKGTKVIVNNQKIFPPSVATGVEEYPPDTEGELRRRGLALFNIDAFKEAVAIGEIRTVNVVMVGALSHFLPVEVDTFFDVISLKVPEKYFEVNKKAFLKGKDVVRDTLLGS